MVCFCFNCGKNTWDLPSKVFKRRIQYRWPTQLYFNNQTSILFCCFHTFSSHICSNIKWVPTKHQPGEAPEPRTGQQQDERHIRREEGIPRGFRRRVREDVAGGSSPLPLGSSAGSPSNVWRCRQTPSLIPSLLNRVLWEANTSRSSSTLLTSRSSFPTGRFSQAPDLMAWVSAGFSGKQRLKLNEETYWESWLWKITEDVLFSHCCVSSLALSSFLYLLSTYYASTVLRTRVLSACFSLLTS